MVQQIHAKFYKDEFVFPSFSQDTYINTFQIVDDNDRIITAGGVRLIPEIILITDKEAPVLDRKSALTLALDFMRHDAKAFHFDNLHVFVDDEKWKHRLLREGFHPSKGECLIIGTGA